MQCSRRTQKHHFNVCLLEDFVTTPQKSIKNGGVLQDEKGNSVDISLAQYFREGALVVGFKYHQLGIFRAREVGPTAAKTSPMNRQLGGA